MRLFSSAFSSQQKTLSGVFISQRRPGLGDYIHAALEPPQGSTRQTPGLCPPCVRFAQSQVPAFHRQRGRQHYFPWNSYSDTTINSSIGEGYCVFQRHVSDLLNHKFVHFIAKGAASVIFSTVTELETSINSNIGEGYCVFQRHVSVRFTQSQVRAFHRQRGSQHYFPWNC